MPFPKDPIRREEAIRKMAETKKRKFASGEKKVWNDGFKGEEYKKHYIDGMKGTFQKGNIPPLKGKKGIHVSPETEFKKGHEPSLNHTKRMRELWQDEEWRQNQINKRVGKYPTEDTLKKICGKIPHNKGIPQSEEQKKQHGIFMKNKWKNDSEFVKKTKEGMKKRIVTEESNIKRSENAKTNSNYGMRGKKQTEEAKMKCRIGTAKRIEQGAYIKVSAPEMKIRNYLNLLNIEFKKQKYIRIKHAYNCDMYIPQWNLVLEVDGMFWHKYPTGREIDRIHNEEIIAAGYNLFRIWENDVNKMSLNDFKALLEKNSPKWQTKK